MECELCLEIFNYSSCKPFSIYPCGHTYCLTCLNALPKQECPKCKIEIKYKQMNYSLMILLEETQKTKSSLLVSNLEKKTNEIEQLKVKLNNKLTELETIKNEKINQTKMKITNQINKYIQDILSEKEKLLAKLEIITSNYDKMIINIKNEHDLNINNHHFENEQLETKLNMKFKKLDDSMLDNQIKQIETKLDELINQTSKHNIAAEYFNEGYEQFFNSKFRKAIKYMNKAIELSNSYTEAYTVKGICLYRLEKFEEAIEIFDKLIDIDSNSIQAYNFKGLSLFESSKLIPAFDQYDKALDLNKQPRTAYELSEKGFTLGCLGKHFDAIEYHNKAIELDSKNYLFYLRKSCDSLNFDNLLALECINKSIELNPNSDMAHCIKAIIFVKLNKCDEALTCFLKAITLNSEFYFAYKQLFELLKKLGKHDQVIHISDEVLKSFPEYVDFYKYKFDSLIQLKMHNHAIHSCICALEKEKNITNVFKYCILILEKYKLFDEVFKYSNNLISDGIKDIYLFELVIKSLIDLKNYQKALIYIENALKIDEKMSSIYKFKSTVCVYLGNFKEAINSMIKLIELNPTDEKLKEDLKKLIDNASQ